MAQIMQTIYSWFQDAPPLAISLSRLRRSCRFRQQQQIKSVKNTKTQMPTPDPIRIGSPILEGVGTVALEVGTTRMNIMAF